MHGVEVYGMSGELERSEWSALSEISGWGRRTRLGLKVWELVGVMG